MMPSKETIYHIAADIYASGHMAIKDAVEYAVKLADLVNQELARPRGFTRQHRTSNA